LKLKNNFLYFPFIPIFLLLKVPRNIGTSRVVQGRNQWKLVPHLVTGFLLAKNTFLHFKMAGNSVVSVLSNSSQVQHKLTNNNYRTYRIAFVIFLLLVSVAGIVVFVVLKAPNSARE
jgi:hypothetical protein